MEKRFLFLTVFLVGTLSGFAQFKLYEKGHDSYTAGRYEEAIQSFSEYLKKSTRDKSLDGDVYYLRALSRYKSGDYKNAIGDFEESLLLNHKNKANIHWFKAKAHDKLGETSVAIEEYTYAIKDSGNDKESQAKLYLERGLLYKKSDDILHAKEDFESGLVVSPGDTYLTRELKDLDSQFLTSRSTTLKEQPKPNEQKTTPAASTTTPGNTKPAAGNPKTEVETSVSTQQQSAKVNLPAEKESNDQKKTESAEKKKYLFQGANNATKKPDENTQVKNLKPNQPSSVTTTQPVDTKPTTTVPVSGAGPVDLYKDEKRYALVIGNSNYPKNIGVLKNPMNDATDLAKELQGSGFDVQLLTNATYGQMRAAMLKFKEKVDAGERDKTVSLFYYAGHGLQHDDENYLVPIDASIEYEDDIARYCFPVQRMVLANMERSNSRMNIVILDACRNNPFPSLNRSLGQEGLGEMRRARGSFIAYATAPGSVASDGVGRNGLYTQELLKAMRKPGLTIEQVFKEVRANVLRLSGDKQNTWDSSNIIGEFYFKF